MRRNWDAARSAPMKRGDQPSEIVPCLYLSGHPARFAAGSGKGFISHPSKHLAEEHGVLLIINCCASPSWADFTVESLRDGSKQPIATFEEFSGLLAEAAACGTAARSSGTPVVFHMNVKADDVDDFNLAQYFANAADAIEAVLSQKGGGADGEVASSCGVLVHCQMGVSRSASVVAAYLTRAFRRPLDDVLAHMEARRSCVSPNPGFVAQLRRWEAEVLRS